MSCFAGGEGKPEELFCVHGRAAVQGELGQCIERLSQPPAEPLNSHNGGLRPPPHGVSGQGGSQ